MITMVITNLSNQQIFCSDIYDTLGPAGTSGASTTVQRSMAQIDSMQDLKLKEAAGTVSVVLTEGTENNNILSVPITEHGKVTALATSGIAIISQAVTFPQPFPTGVKPALVLTRDMSNAGAAVANEYFTALTNTGFTLKLNVTTAGAAMTNADVHWMAMY